MAIYTGHSYARGFRFRDGANQPVALAGSYAIRFRRVQNEPDPPLVEVTLPIDPDKEGRLIFNLPSAHALTSGHWRFEVVQTETMTRLCGGLVRVFEGL